MLDPKLTFLRALLDRHGYTLAVVDDAPTFMRASHRGGDLHFLIPVLSSEPAMCAVAASTLEHGRVSRRLGAWEAAAPPK